MLPVVREALKEQFRLTGLHNNFVFITQYKDHYKTAQSISKSQWKPLLQKCGLEDRRLYETRHTFASLMLQQSEELVWVSAMMGHADVNVTLKRYVRYIKRPQHKRATFVDDLDLDCENKTAQKLHTAIA
ncbi:MAG: tyrosine-type recombinase/integrase [Epsilonproteobacteria bacterium]|nr:tyrosine-type recombinase/integrase [Campylobacterota bacterium]